MQAAAPAARGSGALLQAFLKQCSNSSSQLGLASTGVLPACLAAAWGQPKGVLQQQQQQLVSLRGFRPGTGPQRAAGDGGDGKIIIGATANEVEELIEKNLDQTYRRREDDTPHRVLTTRREALALYRDILRWSLLFVWKDDKGRPWRDVIRESARKEFEEARYESDPEMINRLLVSGRDCVQQVKDRFMQQRHRIIEEEAAAHDSRAAQGGARPPGWPPKEES